MSAIRYANTLALTKYELGDNAFFITDGLVLKYNFNYELKVVFGLRYFDKRARKKVNTPFLTVEKFSSSQHFRGPAWFREKGLAYHRGAQ